MKLYHSSLQQGILLSKLLPVRLSFAALKPEVLSVKSFSGRIPMLRWALALALASLVPNGCCRTSFSIKKKLAKPFLTLRSQLIESMKHSSHCSNLFAHLSYLSYPLPAVSLTTSHCLAVFMLQILRDPCFNIDT
jgi:nitrate reductase NapE component